MVDYRVKGLGLRALGLGCILPPPQLDDMYPITISIR